MSLLQGDVGPVGGGSVQLYRPRLTLRRQGVHINRRVPFLMPIVFCDEVVGQDAEQPGAGIGSLHKATVHVGGIAFDQRVLHQVLRLIFFATAQPPRRPQKCGLILLDQSSVIRPPLRFLFALFRHKFCLRYLWPSATFSQPWEKAKLLTSLDVIEFRLT